MFANSVQDGDRSSRLRKQYEDALNLSDRLNAELHEKKRENGRLCDGKGRISMLPTVAVL